MTIVYITISVLVIIADVVTACHCFAEHKNYSQVLCVTAISSGAVQFTYLMSVFADRYFKVSMWTSFYYLSIDFALLTLITFIRAYTIKKHSIGNKIFKYVLAACFFTDIILMMVNTNKEIVVHYNYIGGIIARYSYTYKPLYSFHLIFDYLMVIVIIFHLIRRAMAVPSGYKRQYLSSIYWILGVVAINAIFLFFPRLFGKDALDYSIWGYSVAAFSIYLNFFRYPVKGMKAYYHGWIVENINQGVVLFNYEDKLIIHNDKIHSIFPDKDIVDDLTSAEFAERLGLELKHEKRYDNYSFQHYVKNGNREIPVRFDHRCLKNNKAEMLGELFVFTDDEGDVDLLTSFYTWDTFKRVLQDAPDVFNPPISVAVCDINGLREINTRLGKNAGDQAIEILANHIRKHFSGESYYVRGQEASLIILSFDLTADEVKEKLNAIQNELISLKGLDYFLNIQSAVGVVNNDNRDVLDVVKQAFKGMKNKKLLDVKSKRSELVTSLVKTLSECDNDTEEHVRRTQVMGQELGKRLGLSDMQLSDLALLCILHDIGKIGIPLEILNKPGRLSDSEWRMMKTHTEKGYQIAMSSQELSDIADMILHHHESWDGRGYPDGLSKESIPMLSRIIAVVDSYDAMVNDRAYRAAMPVEDAVKELRRCAGTQFDPSIVNEFIRMLPEIDEADAGEELEILNVASKHVEENHPASVENTVVKNVHKITYSRYVLDDKMRVIEVDENFEKLTGYSADYIKENEILQVDLLPEEDRTDYLRLVTEQLGQKNLAYFEHRIRRMDGSVIYVFCYGKVYYDSSVRAERSEVIVFDSANTHAMQIMIGEEKKNGEARLAKWEDKYRCDSLTGLLNHEAFKNDVEMKLLEGKSKVMLLMMDVDKFKQYNDTYGHKEGDEFLILIAQTLTSTLRKDDLPCRMGGDEYAAALFFSEESVTDEHMIERAHQICDKLNMILTTQKGGTSLSMGVVISDEGTKTFNQLYEAADRALYDAKESGRGKMMVYGEKA